MRTISVLLILFTAQFAYCQEASPDWMESKPEVSQQASVDPPPLQSFVDKLEQLIRDAEFATRDAKDAAERADTAAKQYGSVMKSAGSWQDDADRISRLEEAVKDLQSRKQWSEGEIRTIAKEEAEKLIKATVKTPDGKTREISADEIQVTVDGYYGTFSVKPGERIVAIDGKPIIGRATLNSNGVKSTLAVTESVQLQSVPKQNKVRFWNLPRSGQTCTNVFNSATGRWERQCN